LLPLYNGIKISLFKIFKNKFKNEGEFLSIMTRMSRLEFETHKQFSEFGSPYLVESIREVEKMGYNRPEFMPEYRGNAAHVRLYKGDLPEVSKKQCKGSLTKSYLLNFFGCNSRTNQVSGDYALLVESSSADEQINYRLLLPNDNQGPAKSVHGKWNLLSDAIQILEQRGFKPRKIRTSGCQTYLQMEREGDKTLRKIGHFYGDLLRSNGAVTLKRQD
jgi:hypothetical protein